MADITAAQIRKVREITGAGMTDVKKALVAHDGDEAAAIEELRTKGIAKQIKRGADRSATNGLVAAAEGALIELACETDFVAKSEKFIALGNTVLQALADSGAETVDAALAAPAAGSTVGQLISDEAATLGEKVELRRVIRIPGDKFSVYLHRTNKDLPPQVGVVVAYTGDDVETARSIAQHISFADPQYLSRDDVPASDVEAERRIVEEISRGEGKPEAALPKIVEGRVTAFFKQVALLEQDYARDNKLSVTKVLADAKLTVTAFARFKVGA
jgi:elongation factor Ts